MDSDYAALRGKSRGDSRQAVPSDEERRGKQK